ncbi:MAG: hypothetical protein AAGF01_19470 [Cyanobacteria bacterium P01_G01_bin.38]
MLDNAAKSTDNTTSSLANTVPDPWEEKLPPEPKPTHPAWQFPLDPKHEIAAVPTPEGILSPQGDPNALQIPAHASHPKPTPTERLLQDELKVNATQAKSLWDHIRDLWALLWWSGPQDESLR